MDPDRPLTLYLVRHGQSSWNVDHRLTGWSDVPLTELGQEQARALRPALEAEAFDGVWSSDLTRARDTARLAYGEPTVDERLREIFFGELEGAIWTELVGPHKEALKNFQGFQAPGGESLVELERRVLSFIDDLTPGRHLLFTHGGVVRQLLTQVGQARFVANCTIVSLDWTNRALEFIREPS